MCEVDFLLFLLLYSPLSFCFFSFFFFSSSASFLLRSVTVSFQSFSAKVHKAQEQGCCYNVFFEQTRHIGVSILWLETVTWPADCFLWLGHSELQTICFHLDVAAKSHRLLVHAKTE